MDADRIFKELFDKHYPNACQYIRRYGFSREDCKEIFCEAIAGFWEAMCSPSVKIEDHKKYFWGILKIQVYLGLKKKKAEAKFEDLDEIELGFESPTFFDEQQHQEELIRHRASSLTNICKKILILFWVRNYTFDQLAEAMGYKNGQTARVRKHKCEQKLRDQYRSKPNDHG